MNLVHPEAVALTVELHGELPDEVGALFALERGLRSVLTDLILESFAPGWTLHGTKSGEYSGMMFFVSWSVSERRLDALAHFRRETHQACDRVTELVLQKRKIDIVSAPSCRMAA